MTNQSHKNNRFVVKPTGRQHYRTPREFVGAMGSHLTPDLWDAIVVRAIQDATLGKGIMRTKAREFLTKHLLAERNDVEPKGEYHEPSSMGAILTEIFDILRNAFMKTVVIEGEGYEAARDALALTLAQLTPEERQCLQEALVESETPEMQAFPADIDSEVQPVIEQLRKAEPTVRVFLPKKGS